jgi:hypothetical protein
MTLLILMVPLMVLAVAVAVVPVLYLSVREHNLALYGSPTRPRPSRPVYALRTVERTGDSPAEPLPVAA